MKILLADDSPAMRTVLRSVLERLGHARQDILEAKDGKDVLRLLQDPFNPPHLVVFDWDLPGMDGLGLLGQIKQLGRSEVMSVLLCVNRRQRAFLPQASKLGPFESIDRPFTEEMFEMKLRGLAVTVSRKAESSNRLRTPPAPPASIADPATPFLTRLPAAAIDDLLKFGDERRHEPGSLILEAGQVCDALHLVTRGQVEIRIGGRLARVVGEGDPVGELSFMMSEPSTYTARAKTAVLTASLSKARISDLLRRHPGLHEQFSSLLSRHQEAMTARATTIVQSDFKGTFDTMPFANVIQILSIGRKTGVLGIRQDEISGGIYLDQGEAVHAWTDEAKGEPAFYALAGLTQAKFAFNSLRRENERTLSRPTITLLMEAMRERVE